MTAFSLLNAAIGLIVAGLVAYALLQFPERFSRMESIGMSLVAAAMILTIGPLLWPGESPYENWAGTLMRVGLCLFFLDVVNRRRAR